MSFTSYLKIPNKKLYLNHNLDTVLGIEENPKEVVLQTASPTAGDPITYGGVTTSSSYFWTNLGGISYYLYGVSLDLSTYTWTDAVDPDTLKGYFIGTNTAGQTLSGLEIQSETLTTSRDSLYLGYSVVFTDSTATAYTTLAKTGVRCRIFSHDFASVDGYVIVPVSDLDEDKEFAIGDVKEYTATNKEIPITGLTTSTLAYTFEIDTPNKIVDSNGLEYDSIGEYYVEWGV